MSAPNVQRCMGLCVLAAALLAAPGEAWSEPVSVEATLILASNDPAPQDQRLDAVEFKLRRMFRFEYYRHFGEGASVVNLPGQASLSLGHGNRLEVAASGAKDDKVRASVQWFRGDDLVLNTTVVTKRAHPVVL
ncbi:MAG: hypothetical protein V2A79_06605, partial [Planctomycetota bacterium]